jgi:hypothetical protein
MLFKIKLNDEAALISVDGFNSLKIGGIYLCIISQFCSSCEKAVKSIKIKLFLKLQMHLAAQFRDFFFMKKLDEMS